MESRLLNDIYHYFVLTGKDVRYTPEAYGFILAGLDFYRSKTESEGHVDADELVYAVCDLARLKFGPMADVVFRHWGIEKALDIGSIVYNLIEMDILSKTEEDTLEQFDLKESIQDLLSKEEPYRISKEKIKNVKDS